MYVTTYAYLVILGILGYVSGYKSYEGYQVLRVVPDSLNEIGILRKFILQYKLDVWKESTGLGSPTDIMISPNDIDLIRLLEEAHLSSSILIDDVDGLIALSRDYARFREYSELNTSRFYNVSEIHEWLEEVAVVCGASCQIIDIGTSYEGRPLKVIKISRDGEQRRRIWLDGGIHAREWLTPAVMTYFVDKLINEDGVDPEVTELRDAFDWYIHPVVNPDGYDYSWTTDRMWRKTRSPNPGDCVGTDPNRNFDFMWGIGSNDTCSQVYQGPSAESESEISSYTDFMTTIGDSVDLSISYHTYGEILVLPWAYSTVEPPDIADLERLATICVNAVNANSTLVYEFGQITGTEGGLSMDWSKGVANIKYSYIMEMRGGGTYGFLAPPSEIVPTSLENWAGVVAMAKDLMQRK
ncbi:hypothetical protein LSH36_503g01028 [Paralvinella palmiformis]|uniref:Peptidase M14 domain-containing protein n=1 Tax=Paralvinella palmiformis TaxID=53620 RepID=A0AAD9J7Z9_9ANNE|nr:hypothetical protein LSH36_503g01028 [Paralvinella palmiformis]